MARNAKKKSAKSAVEVLKEQLRLIADKLTEESTKMPKEPLIVEYDNGGGQSGIRENPYYPAYEKLLASYTKALATAKSLADGSDTEIVSLDAIRSKFKVAK